MGPGPAGAHDAGMDDTKLPNRESSAFRTFPICLDRPQPRTTILGIVARVAAESTPRRSSRQTPLPRRIGVFA
jgi:hypothetical protein